MESPDIVQRHPLYPSIRELMLVIAQPSKFLHALLLDPRFASAKTLEMKVAEYQRAELQAVQQLLDRPEDILAKREADRENQPPNGDQLHVMTIKILFYYVRLWNYTCIVCMDAVRKTQLLMAQLQMHPAHILSATKRRAASISPALEDKSADALSHSMILSSTSSSKRPRLTRSVNEFLVAWFLAHKANPYPSANERAQIAARTDLSEQQVRNWFANMRKRHWKPSHQSKKPRSLLDVVLRKTDA